MPRRPPVGVCRPRPAGLGSGEFEGGVRRDGVPQELGQARCQRVVTGPVLRVIHVELAEGRIAPAVRGPELRDAGVVFGETPSTPGESGRAPARMSPSNLASSSSPRHCAAR